MGSSLSRIKIVETAITQAGRGAELNDHARLLLNAILKDQATRFRYPVLKKVGAPMILPAGATSIAVPDDFGAGAEAMLFGVEKMQILETMMPDFIRAYGFPRDDAQASRPTAFMVDDEAQSFRFNAIADQDYPFIPIYFKLPADLAIDDTDDPTKLWYGNDLSIINGLMWAIYQYTDDSREDKQKGLFEKMDGDYRRGVMSKQNAGQRMRLSLGAFRPRVRR